MTQQKFLEPEMVLEITNKAAMGWSYRQIQDWLMKQHNIKYSHVSIGRCVQKSIRKRKEYTEDILKPYLEKSLTSDLELLQDLIRDANKIKKDAMKTGEHRLALSATDRLTKLVDMRLKMSGAHKEDTIIETVDTDWQEIQTKYGIGKSKEPELTDAQAELIITEIK